MNDVTEILAQIDRGDPEAAEQLLPLVYEELRRLAASKLAQEKPGQTLQATALVHEAYARLVGQAVEQRWDGRGHFFAAAAESMRRILVDNARRKRACKHGGGRVRIDLDEGVIMAEQEAQDCDNFLALNDALDRLAAADSQAAELVKLRYFAGLTREQAAPILGVSPRTIDRIWVYARSFLLREIERS